MGTNFEYMIVYITPMGKHVGLYKGMDKEELDSLLASLKKEGCTVEKLEIIRRTGV
jgi:hypothetical protein